MNPAGPQHLPLVTVEGSTIACTQCKPCTNLHQSLTWNGSLMFAIFRYIIDKHIDKKRRIQINANKYRSISLIGNMSNIFMEGNLLSIYPLITSQA